MTDEQLESAKTMRAAGATYQAIADAVGVSNSTICYWLNPKQREGHRETKRAYKQRPASKELNRIHQRKYAQNPEVKNRIRIKRKNSMVHRCRVALRRSKRYAKNDDYLPCNATVEQLIEAFTGYCDICGVAESGLKKRLSMDHSHEDGSFRGWLCVKCNTSLGKLRDDVGAILAYLDPYNAQRLLHARIGDFHTR